MFSRKDRTSSSYRVGQCVFKSFPLYTLAVAITLSYISVRRIGPVRLPAISICDFGKPTAARSRVASFVVLRFSGVGFSPSSTPVRNRLKVCVQRRQRSSYPDGIPSVYENRDDYALGRFFPLWFDGLLWSVAPCVRRPFLDSGRVGGVWPRTFLWPFAFLCRGDNFSSYRWRCSVIARAVPCENLVDPSTPGSRILPLRNVNHFRFRCLRDAV